MSKSNETLRSLVLITLPMILIMLVILEVFFRTVIPASNRISDHYYEQFDMFASGQNPPTGVTTIGRFASIRAQWRINNYGWNSPIDYPHQLDKPLIAIVGGSYVEAQQVDVDKNFGWLLREKLYPEYEIYTFGKGGAPLSQYLHMTRYAAELFDPEILIINLVHNDFDESLHELNAHRPFFLTVDAGTDGTLTEVPPRPLRSLSQYRPLKRLIYRSALFRYLYLNLQITSTLNIFSPGDNGFALTNGEGEAIETGEDTMSRSNDDTTQREVVNEMPDQSQIHRFSDITGLYRPDNYDMIHLVTEYLMTAIAEENQERRVIFLMDADRWSLYRNTLHKSTIAWMNVMAEQICESKNLECYDLTNPMALDFAENKRYFEFEIDAHWNEYGHRFVSNYIYNLLKEPH